MARRFYHPPATITVSDAVLLFAMLAVAMILDQVDGAIRKWSGHEN